jgi:hypothetical protein
MVPKSKKLTMENVNWVIRNPLFCKDGKRPWNVTRSVRRLRRVHRTAKSSTTLLINCWNHVKWHRTNKLSRWNAISLGNHLAILFTISPKQQTNRTCFLFLTVWIQINFIKNVIRYRLNIVAKSNCVSWINLVLGGPTPRAILIQFTLLFFSHVQKRTKKIESQQY